MADENSLVIKINGSAKDFIDELDKVQKKTESLDKVLSKTAKAAAAAFVVFAGAIALVTKSYADYEKALVGVGKTTDIEGKKLEAFGKQFQKLSAEIPISTNELLGIAQAAGQLGVKGEKDLLKFTETVAKLGVATDLSGEQAATSLTRILNVTKESIDTIDVFGSVIVALGNNFAASESEIVRMTNEVARSTSVFGVSAAQAAGLGTALKSVGVQAQLGGSVVGKAFLKIQAAINSGGTALDNLSNLTGIAGEDLKKTFEEDSVGVFQAFIEGIGKMEGGTSEMFKALEAFGLKGDEINKVLPVLAKNSDLVGRALETAAKETRNATALNREAEKAFATLASTGQRVSNNFTTLKTNIGEALAPAITELLNSVNELLVAFNELDEETISSVASFLKWGAIITGTVASVAAFLLAAVQISAAITAIGLAFLPATISASAFWIAVTGPIGIAVAGFAAVTVGAIALFNTLNKVEKPKSLEDVNRELKRINKEIDDIESRRFGASGQELFNLKKLKEQRKELQGLRKDAVAATEDFGTGELLVRPEQDKTLDFDLDLGGQEIPLRAEKDLKAEEDLKKSEDKKTEIIKAADIKRLQNAKDANEILLAQSQGASEAEIEILQTQQSIDKQTREAGLVQNQDIRAKEFENIGLQQELLKEDKIEFLEAQEAQEAEFRTLVEENELLSQEKKLEQVRIFNAANQTEKDKLLAAEKTLAAQKLENDRKLNSAKFSLAVASADALTALAGDNALVGLVLSKSIAVAQAFIAKSQADMAAVAAGQNLAILNPALGIAYEAKALATNQAVLGLSLGTIAAQSVAGIARAADGGIVKGGAGTRDNVPMMLEAGELIVPKALVPNFIQTVGNPTGEENNQNQGGTTEVIIGFKDDAFDIIEENILERRSIGTGVL